MGKAPRAYYGIRTDDKIAPDGGWAVQEWGKEPAPAVRAVEPLEAVESAKATGNARFRERRFEEALEEALGGVFFRIVPTAPLPSTTLLASARPESPQAGRERTTGART